MTHPHSRPLNLILVNTVLTGLSLLVASASIGVAVYLFSELQKPIFEMKVKVTAIDTRSEANSAQLLAIQRAATPALPGAVGLGPLPLPYRHASVVPEQPFAEVTTKTTAERSPKPEKPAPIPENGQFTLLAEDHKNTVAGGLNLKLLGDK